MKTIDESTVPRSLIIAGAWAWRFLVVIASLWVILRIGARISEVVIPVAVALLFTALLIPFVDRLTAKGVPRVLSILITLIATALVITALVWLIAAQIHSNSHDLAVRGKAAYTTMKSFLTSPAIGLNQHDIDNGLKSVTDYLSSHSQTITTGLKTAGSGVVHILVGIVLALFTLIFVLHDAERIWRFIVRLFPKKAQPAIDGAGKVGWQTLKAFSRSQVIVAAFDGAIIGLGAFLLGLPLAVPIGIFVFLGSFIPVVGVLISGTLAVVIALVFNGWIAALAMLALLIIVHEAEAHILQPFIIGKAVNVHPLATVLSVAIGTIIAGIPGALFAVPVVAVASKSIAYIHSREWESQTNQ